MPRCTILSADGDAAPVRKFVARGDVDRILSVSQRPIRPQWRLAPTPPIKLGPWAAGCAGLAPGFPSHVELALESPGLLLSAPRIGLSAHRDGQARHRGCPTAYHPPNCPEWSSARSTSAPSSMTSGRTASPSWARRTVAPIAALFAATHPERTDRLVLINTYRPGEFAPTTTHGARPATSGRPSNPRRATTGVNRCSWTSSRPGTWTTRSLRNGGPASSARA